MQRLLLLLVLFAAFMPSHLHAQGCAQCRDNAASTSPATRRAYRNGILLLASTATGIFAATVLMLRRNQ